jgi:hypothetical protein
MSRKRMPKTKQWKGFTNKNVDFETSQVPKLKAANLTNRAGHTSNLDQDGLSMGLPLYRPTSGKRNAKPRFVTQ